MSALDQFINVSITLAAASVATASFAITAIFGPSNRFALSPLTGGTTVSGTPNLTAITSMTGCVPGATVSGTGIPTGTYILSVSGSSAVMSANATASATIANLQFQDSIRNYSTLAGMTADGFMTTDPEYVRAAILIQQAVVPPNWYVGRYSASVDQVDTITVNTGTDSHVYVFTLNGTLISFTALDTSTSNIATGLAAAVNTAAIGFTASPSSAIVTITSNVPGVAAVYTAVDSLLTHALSTANHTITQDIAQAQLQNNTWYGTCISSNTDGDITQMAAYIETQNKLFIGVTQTAAVAQSGSSDVASVLGSKGYKRTALIYTNYPTEGKDAAWLGNMLPQVPGSASWAFKQMVGCTPDVLTSSQQTILIGTPEAGIQGKNVNIYQTVAGVSITQMGWVIGGSFIDITVGLDWLKSQIQTNLYTLYTTVPKVPYTDKGTAQEMQQVSAAIYTGVTNGLIDGTSPISVTAPPVLSVPASQRTARLSPNINFNCRLQGAFIAVNVIGNVTT